MQSLFQELQTLRDHTDQVNRAVFAAGDSVLITSSKDRTSIVYQRNPDRTYGFSQLLDESVGGYSAEVEPIAVSSDGGTLVTGGHDQKVKIWTRSADGMYEISQTVEHAEEVESLAVSSDLARIIAGGEDGDIRIWERQERGKYAEAQTFVGHAGAVHSIGMASDDTAFVSCRSAHDLVFVSGERDAPGYLRPGDRNRECWPGGGGSFAGRISLRLWSHRRHGRDGTQSTRAVNYIRLPRAPRLRSGQA